MVGLFPGDGVLCTLGLEQTEDHHTNEQPQTGRRPQTHLQAEVQSGNTAITVWVR